MTRWLFLFITGIATSACQKPPPDPPFIVHLQVTADDGRPVAGARLGLNGTPIGETSERGSLSVDLRGTAGDSKTVDLVCPPGFLDPPSTPSLRLVRTRALDEGSSPRPLTWSATCQRKTRSVALVVRITPQASVPVIVEGNPVATTDSTGIAHVLLDVPSDTPELHVSLDTSAKPAWRPRNPSRVYDLDRSDELVVFHPEFSQAPRPRRRHVRKPAGPPRPYRVD